MKAEEHAAAAPGLHPSLRSTLIQRATPQAVLQHVLPVHKGTPDSPLSGPSQASTVRGSRTADVRIPSNDYNLPAGYTPFLETVNQDMKSSHLTPMRLPSALTTEDFTRAVAVATVSALRHQGSISHPGSARKERPVQLKEEEEEEEGGGHEAPSWTRGLSAGVLLGCTLLYAIIAGTYSPRSSLIDRDPGRRRRRGPRRLWHRRKVSRADSIRPRPQHDGVYECHVVCHEWQYSPQVGQYKLSNAHISMEIGSAYALQVCLLQIPAMVAFSAFYDPTKMGEQVDTFTSVGSINRYQADQADSSSPVGM